MSELKPAASVIVARENGESIEVYLVRRNSRSAFMPDVFVFPGGRVDAQDGRPPAPMHMRGSVRVIAPAYVHAAARETFEEAGLLFATDVIDAPALAAARHAVLTRAQTFTQMLADLRTAVDFAALRYFSHWITPPGEVRRFDTHFFVASAPAGQTAVADGLETHDGIWIAPRNALARHAAGEFPLILPTIKHLERLTAFTRVLDMLEFAEHKPIAPVMPEPCVDRHFRVPAALEGIW